LSAEFVIVCKKNLVRISLSILIFVYLSTACHCLDLFALAFGVLLVGCCGLSFVPASGMESSKSSKGKLIEFYYFLCFLIN
jgi:hypothetical protein